MSKAIGMTWVAMMLSCTACCNMGSSDGKPSTESRSAGTPETKTAANPNTAQGQGNTGATQKGNAATPANQPIAGGKQPVVTPGQQTYPMDAIKPVPDDCEMTHVLLTTAPKSVGPDYQWHVTRQAMLANQQFKFVTNIPTEPGEYYIGVWGLYDNAYALVATCGHAPTCNRLAAMYKAIVRSSNPQVVCKGPIQGQSNNQVGTFRWSDDPKANLPQDGDLQAQCARLNACMIASNQSTPGDPFLECQKAPSKFKTDCAKRYPCAEVVACMGK